jgi:tetratricopeptide (TPR) repeat protein
MLGLLLVAATVAVYAPVSRYDFVAYDDRDYVYENANVRDGLTWGTARWALTANVQSHWHPLTLISHALDWTLYGPWAGGHHLTNVVLHALGVLLLFSFLLRSTGMPERSALVAALFALHPLRVESVAWIAERKDVLSGVFFFAALHAYASWVRRPSRARYAAVLAAFALGLMAKPMVVTFPLVAMLLDRWPLARTDAWRARLLEKGPLLVLAGGSVAATVIAASSHAMPTLATISPAIRLENAVVSLAWYLQKSIWPSRLGVLYMHPAFPGGVPIGPVALLASLAVVTAITVWVVRERDRHPYLPTGWGWYVVMLLPVLGLTQAGIQARADRYGYLPLIGVYVMAVWRVADALATRAMGRAARLGITAACLVVLAGYGGASARQLAVWRNSETLYRNAIAVEPDNFMMHYNFGTVLVNAHRDPEALAEFQRVLAIMPRYADAERQIGEIHARAGRLEDAIRAQRAAVEFDPRNPANHRVLADALLAHGDTAAALAEYRSALALDDRDAHTHNNLGNALLANGDLDGARAAYARAVALDPNLAGAHGNLAGRLEVAGEWGQALEHRRIHVRLDPESADVQEALAVAALHEGQNAEAVAALRAARRLDPARANVRRLLAWALATGAAGTPADDAEALALAEAGARDAPGDPTALVTLAAAQAAAGRFPDALDTLGRARGAAGGDADLLSLIDDMQAHFDRGETYRDVS